MTEILALKLLQKHSFYANTYHDNINTPFVSLSQLAHIESFEQFGQALGAFHLEFKGHVLPGLEIRDAVWFSRSAPYVLAEVAALAEAGEYNLSLSELANLEEVGIMLAELAEPLTGLHSSFVHGDCTTSTAGFVNTQACMIHWERVTCGFPWLDVASLSCAAESISEDCLAALVSSYAEAADYPAGVLGDLLPFVRALHDVYVLDGWNRELTSGQQVGSFKLIRSARVKNLLELMSV